MPRDWPHPSDPPRTRRSDWTARIELAVFILLALLAAGSALAKRRPPPKPVPLRCQLVAIDGDTLRCGKERIRLLGIDAPELPGHCRPNRVCASGDPVEASRSLRKMLGGPASIERQGHDRYGRTLAWVTVDGHDLSCRQLGKRMAEYRPKWDRHGRASACPR